MLVSMVTLELKYSPPSFSGLQIFHREISYYFEEFFFSLHDLSIFLFQLFIHIPGSVHLIHYDMLWDFFSSFVYLVFCVLLCLYG